MAGQIAADNFKREDHKVIESPQASEKLFRPLLEGRTEEAFACAFFDTRHRLIKLDILFTGTIDRATIYPSVVAERSLRYCAAAVIVGHNHPSGDTDPSLADQAITRRLKDALALLDIRLLDHLIVGDGSVCSMAAKKMF